MRWALSNESVDSTRSRARCPSISSASQDVPISDAAGTAGSVERHPAASPAITSSANSILVQTSRGAAIAGESTASGMGAPAKGHVANRSKILIVRPLASCQSQPRRDVEGGANGGPPMNDEARRLEEARQPKTPWRKWGPYLADRQWGTVREDYSERGNAWD